MQWLDNYIRPRKSKNNISESDNFDFEEESICFNNDNAEENDVSEEEREKHVEIKEQKDKPEKKQAKKVKDPKNIKDIARNDKKGKWKATKEFTEIES